MSLTFFTIGMIQDEMIGILKYYLKIVNEKHDIVTQTEHASVQLNGKDYAKIKKIPAKFIIDLLRDRLTPLEFSDLIQFDENSDDKSLLIKSVGHICTMWTHVQDGDEMALQSNIEWAAANRPYFNVYPDYAQMFVKTRLDVPSNSFVFPYKVFDVLFSKEHPPKFGEICVHGFRISETTGDLKKRIISAQQFDNTDDRLIAIHSYYSSGGGEGTIKKGYSSIVLANTGEYTVEQSLAKTKEITFQMMKSKGVVNKEVEESFERLNFAAQSCMRIAISIAFLSSGHDPEVLGPDFIKKDFGAYLEALKKPEGEEQERAIKVIQKKADKERESASFAVGKYEHLLGRRYITHSDSDREPTEGEEGKSGRELQYCHIRNPHFRMVRYGTGRAQVRSKLIKQIIVRKDLPPKPAEVEIGFTTPKAAK